MEIMRHRIAGTKVVNEALLDKIQDVVERDEQDQKTYKLLIETKEDIESWRKLLIVLPRPERELDLMIFRGALYPKWYISQAISYTLVDSKKLINGKYTSKHTKSVPPLTSSVDAVIKEFSLDNDENDISLKRKIRVYQQPKNVKWICSIKNDWATARGFGINPACALLDAVLDEMLVRVKVQLGSLIAYANDEDTSDE